MKRFAACRRFGFLASAGVGLFVSIGVVPGQRTPVSAVANATELSPSPGWHKIPNSKLEPQCPIESSIQGVTGCRSVISEWNGGVADLKQGRLIIWGGGHSDYYGNEVYGLDLRSMSMSRLTEPSPVTNVNECPEAYTDGRPSSRHTYGGLTYDPVRNAMFSFGGSKANCGTMSTAIWKLDLSTLQWSSMEPHRGSKLYFAPGMTSEYDPNTGMIYVSDRENFFRYNSATNTLTQITTLPETDYHLTAVIDPDRKLFLMMGGPGQMWSIGIGARSKGAVQDWSRRVRGCDKLLHAVFPGLAYDPVRRLVVAWVGGDSVTEFDAGKMSCTERSLSGGPGNAQKNGTGGRFRYFPSLGVFVVVNDWKQDAFYLRLGNPDAKPE